MRNALAMRGVNCNKSSCFYTVDKCARCDPHARCNHGKCQCREGWVGTGYDCVKDERCNPICGMYAECQSHICHCQPGYEGDGLHCAAAPPPAPPAPPHYAIHTVPAMPAPPVLPPPQTMYQTQVIAPQPTVDCGCMTRSNICIPKRYCDFYGNGPGAVRPLPASPLNGFANPPASPVNGFINQVNSPSAMNAVNPNPSPAKAALRRRLDDLKREEEAKKKRAGNVNATHVTLRHERFHY